MSAELKGLGPDALDREADKLLRAAPVDMWAAGGLALARRDKFALGRERLHRPVSTEFLEYREVKYAEPDGFCSGCGRPRSYGSAQMCRACYRNDAILRYFSVTEMTNHYTLISETAAFGEFAQDGPGPRTIVTT